MSKKRWNPRAQYKALMLKADERTRTGSLKSRQYWVKCRNLLQEFAYYDKQPTEGQLRWICKMRDDLKRGDRV